MPWAGAGAGTGAVGVDAAMAASLGSMKLEGMGGGVPWPAAGAMANNKTHMLFWQRIILLQPLGAEHGYSG
jgi:hypothetical protein